MCCLKFPVFQQMLEKIECRQRRNPSNVLPQHQQWKDSLRTESTLSNPPQRLLS